MLADLIKAYQAKHDDVRRPKTGEDLISSIDSIRSKMAESEGRLRDVQKQADIISLDESKKAVATTIEKATSELNEVVMDREVTGTILKGMKRDLPAAQAARTTSNGQASAAAPEVPPAILQEYKQDSAILASLASGGI